HPTGGDTVLHKIQSNRRDVSQEDYSEATRDRGSTRGGAMRHHNSEGLQRGIVNMLVIAAWLLTTTVALAGDAVLNDPRTMKFAPVEFSPPEPARHVLENGMVVYLLEDHELPLVSLSATMRTGGWLEPQEKIGLAGLTGSLMRTGGGGGLTAEKID